MSDRVVPMDGEGADEPSSAQARERVLRDRVAATEDFLERIGQVAGVGGWKLDLDSGTLTWTAQTCRIHDRPVDHRPTLDEAISYYAPGARAVLEAAVMRGIEHGEGWDIELPLTTAAGRAIWVRAQGAVEQRAGKASRLIGAIQDITDRRRDIDALIASERRFRSLFTYSLGLICTHDLAGRLLTVNPAACRSLGFEASELVGRNVAEFMPAADAAGVPVYLARIAARGVDSGRLRFIAADGSHRIWQYHNITDTIDGEVQVLGHAQDITDQMRQEERLREWSLRDALTGCHNRRYLAAYMEEGGRDGSWSCITLDLDKFKLINDTYGHQRGDEVLAGMADFFRAHVLPGDVVIRLGGDEFLVLQPGGDLADAQGTAARLEQAAASAPCGFTTGIAVHMPGRTVEATLAAADHALYAVRRERRGLA